MAKSDAIEKQRQLRSLLQQAKRELTDPHAVGRVVVPDMKSVEEGLQENRQVMPLLAEIGDTFGALAMLIEAMADQIDSLKSQVAGTGPAGDLVDPGD